jgi:hypothetical protein
VARFVLISMALALVVSCYSPTIRDCAYTCAADTDCPSSQSCDTALGMCRAAGATGACGAPIDAPTGTGDAPTIDAFVADAAPFAFTPSNYVLQDLDGLASPSLSVTGTLVLDTGSDGPNSVLFADTGTGGVRLYRFRSLTIAAHATLDIRGPSSAIFSVDDDVTVDGTINGLTQSSRVCQESSGSPGDNCSAGGAGGSYGAAGGRSGDCQDSLEIASQVPAPSSALVPLLPGCAGGASPSKGAATGLGGAGGAGLEISARGMITLGAGSMIGVGGGGGSAGIAANGFDPGGGGGGTGGGLLLEAQTITGTSTSILCAAGGGGGTGADNNTNGSAGGPGCATESAGMLGGVGANGGASPPGGNGGGTIGQPSSPGFNGFDVESLTVGGGGAGGSTGVIVVRAKTSSITTVQSAPAPISLTAQ